MHQRHWSWGPDTLLKGAASLTATSDQVRIALIERKIDLIEKLLREEGGPDSPSTGQARIQHIAWIIARFWTTKAILSLQPKSLLRADFIEQAFSRFCDSRCPW